MHHTEAARQLVYRVRVDHLTYPCHRDTETAQQPINQVREI